MPNLRGKTWTPTTPAYTEDAQFWEDHLVEDGKIEGLEESVEELEKYKHWHNNKTVLDELTEDEDGDLNYKSEKIKGGVENVFSHVKVGNTTIDSEKEDTLELEAGSNITMTVEGKKVRINSTGGGGGASGGDMTKEEFVLEGGTGQVLSSKHADNAAAVGEADTEVLENLSDNNGNLYYKGKPIGGGGGQGGSTVYVSTNTLKGYPVSISITDRITGITETQSTKFGSDGNASFNVTSIGVATITVVDGSKTYTSTVEITSYSVYKAPDINKFGASIIVTAKCGTSGLSGAEIILNGEATGITTDSTGNANVTVGEIGSYVVGIKKDGVISDNTSTVNITSEATKTCNVYIARIKYTFTGILTARVTGNNFSASINAQESPYVMYVPRQQIYSLAGSLGDEDVETSVNVNSYDEIECNVRVFRAKINVTTVAGASVTVTNGVDTFTEVATSGVANITVKKASTYTITATVDGVTSQNTASVTISAIDEEQSATIDFASIKLIFEGTLVANVVNGSFSHAINTSSSPYEFYVPYIGNYTLIGTVDSFEIDETIYVEGYSKKEYEIITIPDGATVQPANDIQTWLRCAEIKNKDYTTISQVLNDTSALATLIASQNACNYMARSTNWCSDVASNQNAMTYIGNNSYCCNKLLNVSAWNTALCNSSYFEKVLNTKIPTMTSTTSPSGKVTYGSQWSSAYQALNIFNGSASDWFCQDGVSAANAWIQYEFPKETLVKKIYAKNTSVDLYAISEFKLMASKTGNFSGEQVTLGTFAITKAANATKTENVNNNTYYKYYRIYLTVNSSNRAGLNAVQMYGRTQ